MSKLSKVALAALMLVSIVQPPSVALAAGKRLPPGWFWCDDDPFARPNEFLMITDGGICAGANLNPGETYTIPDLRAYGWNDVIRITRQDIRGSYFWEHPNFGGLYTSIHGKANAGAVFGISSLHIAN
jgi:hypothetical protein